MDAFRVSNGLDCPIFKYTCGFMAGLSTLLFLLLFYETFRFIRIYRFKNKCLLCFLIMMNIYCLQRISYHLIEMNYYWLNLSIIAINFIKFNNTQMLFRDGTCGRIVSDCIDGIFSYINISIFASAIMFNIFNWLYSINDVKGYFNLTKVPNKIYHTILVISQLSFIGIVVYLFYNSCIDESSFYLISLYASWTVQLLNQIKSY